MSAPTATRRAAVATVVVALVLALTGIAVAVNGGVDHTQSAVTASVDQAASSPAGQIAGTRVSAHDHHAAAGVAAPHDVLAGQGRAATTLAAKEVVGSRIAHKRWGAVRGIVSTSNGSSNVTVQVPERA